MKHRTAFTWRAVVALGVLSKMAYDTVKVPLLPRFALAVATLVLAATGPAALAAQLWLDDLSHLSLANHAPRAPEATPADWVEPTYFGWMHKDVRDAWSKGYVGQGTRITVVDNFRGTDLLWGNLEEGLGLTSGTHGYWTRRQVEVLTSLAKIRSRDYGDTNKSLSIGSSLEVFNLSYLRPGADGLGSINWDKLTRSIINAASEGTAVVVKGAGNEYGEAVTYMQDGRRDYLARDLIGTRSVLFVGALSTHGTKNNKASLAAYSTVAGGKKKVQKRFLVVGVRTDLTNLAGTSFAAPIVSGYASILGSKFRKASATQISNQLLETTRTGTILNYKKSLQGMGEACLSCALAPKKIK